MSAEPDIGGTSVAVYQAAMRWSETITIYLAAGAPFSVSCYLHEREGDRRVLPLLKAAALGLLWPFAVLRILFAGYGQTTSDAMEDRLSQQDEARVHNAKRNLLAALHGMSELAANTGDTMHKDLERAACVLRESVETYVGLAPAVMEFAVDASPNENAMELFRIAGYKGNDVAVAATCANRRNVARIIQHHTRARVQMVHAIADIREAVESSRTSMAANGSAERRLRLASMEVYKLAIDLLVLMGDEETAIRIAGLLNHELSRLWRVEHRETRKVLPLDTGEEPCTAHTSRLSQAPLSNEATMAQG